MKCFYCKREACAKIGSAKGNMLAAFLPSSLCRLLGIRTWEKSEQYVCRHHFYKKG